MRWFLSQIRWLQALVSAPQILALIVVFDVAAYFAGLLYWYGDVMGDPATPVWAWVFIPDCPLFGAAGALGLLTVTGQRYWSEAERIRARRGILLAALVAGALWLSTYLPAVPAGWVAQGPMWGVLSALLGVGGLLFLRAPSWWLGLVALGQIKYGIWTITAWMLFWQKSAIVYGEPLITVDGIFMTVTHIGLAAQGLLLLTYFRPTVGAAIAGAIWFGMSDFVDYGLGFYPAIPSIVPLPIIQWSTVAVTGVLVLIYFVMGSTRRAPAGVAQHSSRAIQGA
jgi:uncharacterized membrane protein YpjA